MYTWETIIKHYIRGEKKQIISEVHKISLYEYDINNFDSHILHFKLSKSFVSSK